MNDLLPIIGVAAIAFLATNADNLLLLFAFLADRSFKPWQVIVGYALGMVAILALSWLVAWFAHFLRPDYVGFLGVVPIGLGLKRLYDRFVRYANSAEPASSRSSTHSQIITVALADVAHGPDTIILFQRFSPTPTWLRNFPFRSLISSSFLDGARSAFPCSDIRASAAQLSVTETIFHRIC